MKKQEMTLGKAFFVFVFLIASLIITITKLDNGPHIPLAVSTILAALVAVQSGYRWSDLEDAISETMKVTTQPILIMIIIGALIGTWTLAGIVPTMIYYGLTILSRSIFLLATCIICSVVSLATGSSWSTIGTIGVALMGVGIGLEIPKGMVAGAIISGSYFGDKMSPLSDTTNLAPAMAGADMFDHIKHMVYTTAPSYVIALVLYGFLGMGYSSGEMNHEMIDTILNTLSNSFNINLILLIPPILVILMVIKKVPAVPGLTAGACLGALFAFLFQGSTIGEIVGAANAGYTASTGVELVDNLVQKGGIQSMMWTVSLILIALCFAGIVEKSGMINVVASKLLEHAKSDGSLIATTIGTAIFCNFATGVQYMALIIPGRMYRDVYKDRGLAPKNLSRALEDSGTLVAPLVPWSTDAAFMRGTLAIGPEGYVIYSFLNLLSPIISIIYGYLGFTIEKLPSEHNLEEDQSSSPNE